MIGLESYHPDTIVALASGSVPAGVAVIRVSGPMSADIARAMLRQELPQPRKLVLRSVIHPLSGEVLDRGLAAWFAGPNSFTGEDILELHLHGGPAVVEDTLEAITTLSDPASQSLVRMAQPGEFTRRAFDNGRLDLTSVEGLADLVRAGTSAQRRQALAASVGEVRARLETWRQVLVRSMALIEASIDFADEDLPDDLLQEVTQNIENLVRELSDELRAGDAGTRVRDGFLIAIVGPPNAGKSSLLNALAGKEAAIVSSIPGTTRDIVEVSLDMNGYAITIADTAGLREAADQIEQEGVRRAKGLIRTADMTILVLDGSDRTIAAEGPDVDFDAVSIVAVNKADLMDGSIEPDTGGGQKCEKLVVSAKTGAGLEKLRIAIMDKVSAQLSAGEQSVITRARHREAVLDMQASLLDWHPALEAELQAHHVQAASRALDRLIGKVDVEDMLGMIFSEFCIGK